MQKIHNQSPNVRVQSLPISQNELGAWQNGSVHVRTLLTQEYSLVAIRSNSKLKVFDTIAAICKVLDDFGAIISIGWQACSEKLVCRYVIVNRIPKLIVDIFQHESDRLTIRLSNGERWQVNHDELNPDFAHNLAYEIRSVTKGMKRIKFKQEALQSKEKS